MKTITGSVGVTLTYFARQLISREVEVERLRRATPKITQRVENEKSNAGRKTKNQQAAPKKLPNHMQTLNPKINAADKGKLDTVVSFFKYIV